MKPLDGIRIVDFTTLLPGPLATLMLARAGAEVIKIERPQTGDEMRRYQPRFGDASSSFALLNEAKRSIAIDLKDDEDKQKLIEFISTADVVIEQFRPGVMQRLGLDYETLRKSFSKLIYVSITGYGQSGPNANEAGHDLNYLAASGLLDLARDEQGNPGIPPILAADIAGGSYPAVMNILLALRQRDKEGAGSYIDVCMTDNLFPLGFWAWGQGMADGDWPRCGDERLTGGSPRYQIYKTKDARYLAAAPLEQRFWNQFCELIGLHDEYCDVTGNSREVIQKVKNIIAGKTSVDWEKILSGHDVCCNIVLTMEEAVQSQQVSSRQLFDRQIENKQGESLATIPVPFDASFQSNASKPESFPLLGEANEEFGFAPVEA